VTESASRRGGVDAIWCWVSLIFVDKSYGHGGGGGVGAMMALSSMPRSL
jgi:hypothetical protein